MTEALALFGFVFMQARIVGSIMQEVLSAFIQMLFLGLVSWEEPSSDLWFSAVHSSDMIYYFLS